MNDCIFCSIRDGKVPGDIFYEDEHFLAFLDIRPHNKGHSLLIPKEHSTALLEANESIQAALGPTTVRLGKILKQTLNTPGLNIISNIGAEAGQIIFHTHFHFIPRPDHSYSKSYTYPEGEKEVLLKELRTASGYPAS